MSQPPDWITPALLRRLGASDAHARRYAGPLAEAARRYGVTTRIRLAHFLAQVAHESDRFRAAEEYASGRAYEGRRDLGNTQRGDGVRFKGRGLIQLTGRANYTRYRSHLFVYGGPGGSGVPDVVESPERVSDPDFAADVAGWYWQDRGLARLADRGADRGAIAAVTKAVNGGTNGLEDRVRLFAAAYAALAEAEGQAARDDAEAVLLALGETGRKAAPYAPLAEVPGRLPIATTRGRTA